MRFLSSLIVVGCVALVCSGSLATKGVAQEDGDNFVGTPVELGEQTVSLDQQETFEEEETEPTVAPADFQGQADTNDEVPTNSKVEEELSSLFSRFTKNMPAMEKIDALKAAFTGENSPIDPSVLLNVAQQFRTNAVFVNELQKISQHVLDYMKEKNVTMDPKTLENMSEEEKILATFNNVNVFIEGLQKTMQTCEGKTAFYIAMFHMLHSLKEQGAIDGDKTVQGIRDMMEEVMRGCPYPKIPAVGAEYQETPKDFQSDNAVDEIVPVDQQERI